MWETRASKRAAVAVIVRVVAAVWYELFDFV